MSGIAVRVNVVKTTSPVCPTGRGLPVIGIDDLKEEIRFAEVVPVKSVAFDASAKPHLGGAVMAEDLALPYPLEFSYHRGRHVIRTERNALDAAGRYHLGLVMSRQGEHLSGNAHQAIDFLVCNVAESGGRVSDDPVNESSDTGTMQPSREEIPDAARSVAGQKYEDLLSLMGEGCHAAVKEIDSTFQVFRRESNPQRRNPTPRHLQGDHSFHLALGGAEELRSPAPQVFLSRSQAARRDPPNAASPCRRNCKPITIKGAPLADVIDDRSKPFPLVPANAFQGQFVPGRCQYSPKSNFPAVSSA